MEQEIKIITNVEAMDEIDITNRLRYHFKEATEEQILKATEDIHNQYLFVLDEIYGN